MNSKKIWVDADACPIVIREIICRAAARTEVETTFVANQFINLPQSPFLKMMQVEPGFDIADNQIVALVTEADLVVTNDIPLAAEAIEKGAFILTPRGFQYTADNIKPKLNMRDFMETMRTSGVHSGGPPPLNANDKQKFANGLDKFLAGSLKVK